LELTIEHYKSIDSTSDELKRRKDVPPGVIVIADEQTAGRGQHGRTFHSPPNCGVYFSMALRPKLAISKFQNITCACAVILSDVLESLTGIRCQIKWINDLYLNRKKVAGILVETKLKPNNEIDYVIIGVGINLLQPPKGYPQDIAGTAGYILTDGDFIELRKQIVLSFAKRVFELSDDFNLRSFLPRYRALDVLHGQAIQLVSDSETLNGVGAGIDDDFRLLVLRDDNSIIKIGSGKYRLSFA